MTDTHERAHDQHERVAIKPDSDPGTCAANARTWVKANVPEEWRRAAEAGGHRAVRSVRTRAAYATWYPVFGNSGLVMPTWATEHGGLGVSREAARAIAEALAP